MLSFKKKRNKQFKWIFCYDRLESSASLDMQILAGLFTSAVMKIR